VNLGAQNPVDFNELQRHNGCHDSVNFNEQPNRQRSTVTPEEAKKFGRFIADARKARGLTMQAVADAVGLSKSAIFYIEQGRFEAPRVPNLQKLARALEVPVEDLYARAGYTMPEQLPELVPYLRAKYDLPAKAVDELGKYFEQIQTRYGENKSPKEGGKKTGGRRGSRSR
jgi:transcriptional regulator with XRE-family HTH domain